MAGLPFTFLHTSDLHLEQPLHGVAEVPDHLRDLFLDAPFRATRSVFDAAIEHRVDFVVVAGDAADWFRAGPRASFFFAEQCQRLAADSIHVYWLGSEVDRPRDWPGSIELPSSVHRVASGSTESLIHERDGEPIARFVGLGHDSIQDSQFINHVANSSELTTIAILHGKFNATAATDADVAYWALGGDHGRRTVTSSTATTTLAHYCGTPQGRSFRESGPHHATLVRVDGEKDVHLDAIATDYVVWHQERIDVGDETISDEIEELLAIRISELTDQYTDRQLCIAWTVLGGSRISRQFRCGSLAEQLTQQLRDKYGNEESGAWTVTVEFQRRADLPDAWYDEDTIRGAFLRQVRELRKNGSEPLVLEPLLMGEGDGKSRIDSFLTSLMDVDDAERREQLLQEVAELGADLLSGQE